MSQCPKKKLGIGNATLAALAQLADLLPAAHSPSALSHWFLVRFSLPLATMFQAEHDEWGYGYGHSAVRALQQPGIGIGS